MTREPWLRSRKSKFLSLSSLTYVMALWMQWSAVLNLDRSGWGTMSLGMGCVPLVIWDATIDKDAHLFTTLAPGRLHC